MDVATTIVSPGEYEAIFEAENVANIDFELFSNPGNTPSLHGVRMLEGFLAPLTRAIAGQAAVADPRFRKSPLFSKGVNWSVVKIRADSTRKPISDLVGLPLGPL